MFTPLPPFHLLHCHPSIKLSKSGSIEASFGGEFRSWILYCNLILCRAESIEVSVLWGISTPPPLTSLCHYECGTWLLGIYKDYSTSWGWFEHMFRESIESSFAGELRNFYEYRQFQKSILIIISSRFILNPYQDNLEKM